MSLSEPVFTREPWNKGKLIGQKLPLKPEEVWSIRVRLDMAHKVRDLALFNLAVNSKLRGCDLVKLTVSDIARGTEIVSRYPSRIRGKLRSVQSDLSSYLKQHEKRFRLLESI